MIDDPRFAQVQALLEAIKSDLNTKRFSCEGCTHTRYENFEQYQAAEVISGFINKIERWQGKRPRGQNEKAHRVQG